MQIGVCAEVALLHDSVCTLEYVQAAVRTDRTTTHEVVVMVTTNSVLSMCSTPNRLGDMYMSDVVTAPTDGF